ncbi:MAG TPA: hypothetical protein PLV57_11830 [Phycisphaerae bacterium]|nr:hypothetical protein [Phycisphaerae bacterium]HOM52949.1 hypothetical protein [Phycisphaerae bacterium]HPP27202.1 hypothetical protein [Phycisphaerae bacterium]
MKRTELPPSLARVLKPSLIVGAGALLACAGGGIVNARRFFESYLAAYLLFLGIALGSNAMLMVHQLVGGNWGRLVRRLQEAAAASLPLMALLFIPILFGLPDLYPWADSRHAGDPLFQLRRPYLNPPFFLARAAVYFAIWIVAAWLMRRWANHYEENGQTRYYTRLQRLSAGGLVLYVFTVSFAAVDWIMSREPQWFSTIIGFLVVAGQALSGMAAVVLLLALVVREEPLAGAASRQDFNDLGNILLTLVILFSYMAFVQFLIQWYGNTQEDIAYYVPRMRGGWAWVGAMLIVFHFFVPFFLLLVRFNKRRVRILGAICALLLFMRLVDNVWLIVPSGQGTVHWTLIASVLGIGGVWLATFLYLLGTRPLLAQRDPAMVEDGS